MSIFNTDKARLISMLQEANEGKGLPFTTYEAYNDEPEAVEVGDGPGPRSYFTFDKTGQLIGHSISD